MNTHCHQLANTIFLKYSPNTVINKIRYFSISNPGACGLFRKRIFIRTVALSKLKVYSIAISSNLGNSRNTGRLPVFILDERDELNTSFESFLVSSWSM